MFRESRIPSAVLQLPGFALVLRSDQNDSCDISSCFFSRELSLLGSSSTGNVPDDESGSVAMHTSPGEISPVPPGNAGAPVFQECSGARRKDDTKIDDPARQLGRLYSESHPIS